MAGRIACLVAGVLLLCSTCAANSTLPTSDRFNPVQQEDFDILCRRTVDMFFAIDASDSLTEEDFLLEKAFVKEVIEGLYLNEIDGIVVGVVVFSTNIFVQNNFNDDKFEIFTQIDDLTQDKDGTNTHDAIREVRKQLMANGRPGVEKAGIIITDGRSKNPDLTLSEAILTKELNITLGAVGVGALIDVEELRGIASHDGLVYTSPDFSSLRNLTVDITGVLCPELLSTTTTTTTTTPLPTTTTTTPPPTTTTTPYTTTTTPPPTTTTPYVTTTTPPPPLSPCEDDCRFIDNVGYVADPYDCTKFYHCEHRGGGLIIPTRKDCPTGLFWSQSALTCVRPSQTVCPIDRCTDNIVSYYLHKINCNAYWVCEGGKTSKLECCPPGMSFNLAVGKCEVSTCFDTCPLDKNTQDDFVQLCDKYSLASNPNIYLQQPLGFPYPLQLRCPAGLGFNNFTCNCDIKITVPVVEPKCVPEVYLPLDKDFKDYSGKNTYIEVNGPVIVNNDPPFGTVGGGAAKFNGKSYIAIPSFSNAYFGTTLRITFRYLPLKAINYDTRQEALVTNSACNQPATVAIAYDRSEEGTYCAIETSGKGNQGNLLRSTGSTDIWRDVSYTYDGANLRLEVNTDVDVASAFGPITTTPAALRIGAQCDQFQGFTGYIDEVRIWKCFV